MTLKENIHFSEIKTIDSCEHSIGIFFNDSNGKNCSFNISQTPNVHAIQHDRNSVAYFPPKPSNWSSCVLCDSANKVWSVLSANKRNENVQHKMQVRFTNSTANWSKNNTNYCRSFVTFASYPKTCVTCWTMNIMSLI